MTRSLALGAYLALAGLSAARPEPEAAPRPEGPLLWIHSDGMDRLASIAALAERLDGEISTLVTLPRSLEPCSAPGRLILRPAPLDRPGAVTAFLEHWAPDLLLWTGGGLRPALVAGARMPRLLVEGAPAPRLLDCGSRWPRLARAIVPLFDHALVAGDAAAERLSRAGMPEERLEIAGPLDVPAPVLLCNERERRDLAQTIGARPVWLASDLPLSELPAVVAAHRLASRTAHRLLLILAPRNPEEAQAMASAVTQAGLRVAQRAEGDEPEDGTQVYLADGPTEMGLWLRLAPVAFLGGTLPGGPGGRDPFEAAALGVALIHGAATAPHKEHWARLDAAGASRLVLNGLELGRAVEALLSPDRTAAMAHAGWDVTTKGAEVANRVADLIREALERREAASGPSAGAPSLAAVEA